jgi:phage terminase large subunit GpA-like protein
MTSTAPVVAPASRSHVLGRRALNRVTRERFRRHCRPLPRLTMSQWAERYRVLSAEASANHGPWQNDVAPYLVDVMDALSDRVTQEVTFVAPSQSGKSEVLLNAIGYFIHQEPSPMIVVQPTVETGESFSKDRIAPMLRDSPALAPLVAPARSRDSNNTILSKQYPGGQCDIAGANAPSGLAMRPKRFMALDERDRHPRSAGKEGDVKTITRARTRSYKRRRKIYEVSSPTDAETSLIWPSYLEGTQEVYEVPCPYPACGHFQTLHFERLKWETDEAGQVIAASVGYECAACATRIPATARDAMLRAGRWAATAAPRVPHKRSFRLHGLCAAFALWEEIAQEFVTANGQQDPALRADMLRAFFNTTLGELYKDQQAETAKAALLARAKAYAAEGADGQPQWHVPREAAILCAGMDLQHDRGEIVVRAYGVGEESWLVERAVLRGDTSQPAWWATLEEYRTRRTWLHESGARLSIRALAIDAGDGTHAKAVYTFCAPRLAQHVYAVKGSSNPAAPMIPVKHTKVKPGRLYVIGVNAIMDRLYRRLAMPERGPGYLHVNTFADEDFVTQLLSMRRVLDERTRKRRWEATPGVRNEVADAETYAYAAFLLGPVPATMLADEVVRVNLAGARAASAPAADGSTAPVEPAPRTVPPALPSRGTPHRRSFVNRWR